MFYINQYEANEKVFTYLNQKINLQNNVKPTNETAFTQISSKLYLFINNETFALGIKTNSFTYLTLINQHFGFVNYDFALNLKIIGFELIENVSVTLPEIYNANIFNYNSVSISKETFIEKIKNWDIKKAFENIKLYNEFYWNNEFITSQKFEIKATMKLLARQKSYDEILIAPYDKFSTYQVSFKEWKTHYLTLSNAEQIMLDYEFLDKEILSPWNYLLKKNFIIHQQAEKQLSQLTYWNEFINSPIGKQYTTKLATYDKEIAKNETKINTLSSDYLLNEKIINDLLLENEEILNAKKQLTVNQTKAYVKLLYNKIENSLSNLSEYLTYNNGLSFKLSETKQFDFPYLYNYQFDLTKFDNPVVNKQYKLNLLQVSHTWFFTHTLKAIRNELDKIILEVQ